VGLALESGEIAIQTSPGVTIHINTIYRRGSGSAHAACSSLLADESEDKSRIWEKYAVHTYSNLNAGANGELTQLFRAFGGFGEFHQYFDRDRNPKKYEAYLQFIIQVFADAMRGDVGAAMFANVVLEMTPTYVLLPMIAPEIGLQGRLHGILEGKLPRRSNAEAR
jgi:hypothetical protein